MSAREDSTMTRIWNVARLHLVNRMTYLWLPWIILGSAFAVSLSIWAIIRSTGVTDGVDGTSNTPQISGALLSILVYLMVAAVMAINLTFPFALGFSVTRRDFYLGTALTFVLISAINAVPLTILGAIEQATNGWGLRGLLFTAPWMGGGNAIEHWLGYFALQLFFCFVGAAIATIYMRWRVNGMVIFWIAGSVVLVGVFAYIAYTNSWAAIGSWLIATGTTGAIAWSLLVTALAGLAGFAVLRRATPKN